MRDVARNKPTLCPEISEVLVTSRLEEDAHVLDQLSPREFEVLLMIVDAKSTDEIAAAFNLTPNTVANHHYAIKSKLNVTSDIDLIYLCMRQGVFTSIVGVRS